LSDAWSRVVGLVIQPGVEFGDAMVHDYQPTPALTAVIDRQPGLAYEAHSTDYQSGSNLARLVQNHFFILKVGPWLTYALQGRACSVWNASSANSSRRIRRASGRRWPA
jgi:tagatose-1,6-bisphosphate aldolase non-catalytic subunit AgaZ/GatZ